MKVQEYCDCSLTDTLLSVAFCQLLLARDSSRQLISSMQYHPSLPQYRSVYRLSGSANKVVRLDGILSSLYSFSA